MFRIFYAEKDATLYEYEPYGNVGLDEILEVGKRFDANGNVKKSRSLVQFDMAEVTAAIAKYGVDINQCKAVLQLYTTHAKNLPGDYTIEAKLVGQPWQNGTGFEATPTTDGVTWTQPAVSWSFNTSSGANWISGSQGVVINSSTLQVAGTGYGGSWIEEVTGTSSVFDLAIFNQNFFAQGGLNTVETGTMRPTDISIDVTQALQIWISGSNGHNIPNNGFLIKLSDTEEQDVATAGYIRYFSRETHTIYVPKLVLYWNNATFNNGTLPPVAESFSIYTEAKPTYKDTEVAKIRIFARDKYPRKSPTNLAPYETVKYLPESTFYSIVDAATDETIIPFDDIYTKISCDSTSNFIYLDMTGFMPERNYRLQLKVVDGFVEQYIDDLVYFKVTR
jgi:hypothetical protein